MRKFRFRLEPVLTVRAWEEERARAAYGQALRQEQKFAEALRAMDERIEKDVVAWRGAAAQAVPAGEQASRWRHLLALERERNDTAQKLLTARRIREQKMKVLVDTHRRVQVLETLKEQRRHAHVVEQRRAEEREIEDLVSARFQPDL